MTPRQIIEALLLEGYKYAVTMILLPERLSDFIIDWGQINIPDENLYRLEGDDSLGREREPHVTVKYGFTTNDVPDILREIVHETKPFPVYLGRVSLFDNNPEYDVVKIGVESPWLRKLNSQISLQIPNEDKYPSYNPHITIAYVKKGTAAKLVGADLFESGEVDPEFIAYGLQFNGACEDCEARTKEMLLFSKVKEPEPQAAIAEADDPDPKRYIDAVVRDILNQPVPAKIVSDESGEAVEFDAREGLSHLPDDWIEWLRRSNFQACEPADRVADYGGTDARLLQDAGPYEVYIDAEAAERFVPYRPKKYLGVSLPRLGRMPESIEEAQTDPDEVSAKSALMAVPVRYVIRLFDPDDPDTPGYAWCDSADCAIKFPTFESAQRALKEMQKEWDITQQDIKGVIEQYIQPSRPELAGRLMLVAQNPEDAGDPLVQCPVCHHRGNLMSDFTYLKAGFNGIRPGDPDDVDAQECGNCGAKLEWKHLDEPLGEATEPEPDAKKALLALPTYYVIKHPGCEDYWNVDWGWSPRTSVTRFRPRADAERMMKERIGVGEVVPVIRESLQEADPDQPQTAKELFQTVPVYYVVTGEWPGHGKIFAGYHGEFTYDPVRMVPYDAKIALRTASQRLPDFGFQMVPAEDQSQMYWQGKRWPQDFPDFSPVDSREESCEVLMLPTYESKAAAPDPYGGMGFPSDPTRLREFLRARQKRRKKTLL
jgi:2'-5' RNA ligase superfamily